MILLTSKAQENKNLAGGIQKKSGVEFIAIYQ